MPTPASKRQPKKLRKQYTNRDHTYVVLRFEDGHEITVARGVGKAFDAYPGETIKVLSVTDASASNRELVESRRAEEFEDAPGEE